ncbi:MAG: hypothetical protein A2W93_14310 [Bacteroidetes bacterium GWF2_43_63]|nr:MAG: hypothetical protein A2W94_00880 [Bacteroidetes bacterium GWE2_42_42]OFY52514.1 MAG: hypothetical protein A2W93_14310 [Bacteroidetes bacterium GWF2_43_63]HBG71421.1 hypothetical protein [Bacteroidales bacterium]HCB60827.1 hypothetical protein [Bacteroidales bacterium]HCY23448.1 hypothetical protein [Bacteroidales bacterium]
MANTYYVIRDAENGEIEFHVFDKKWTKDENRARKHYMLKHAISTSKFNGGRVVSGFELLILKEKKSCTT